MTSWKPHTHLLSCWIVLSLQGPARLSCCPLTPSLGFLLPWLIALLTLPVPTGSSHSSVPLFTPFPLPWVCCLCSFPRPPHGAHAHPSLPHSHPNPVLPCSLVCDFLEIPLAWVASDPFAGLSLPGLAQRHSRSEANHLPLWLGVWAMVCA